MSEVLDHLDASDLAVLAVADEVPRNALELINLSGLAAGAVNVGRLFHYGCLSREVEKQWRITDLGLEVRARAAELGVLGG